MEYQFRKQAQSNLGRWQQGGGMVTMRWQEPHPAVLTVRTRHGVQQWTNSDVRDLIAFLQEYLEASLALEGD